VRQIARLERILAADRDRTGRQHLFGAAATTDLSLVDCINRADAVVSDVSGVLSEALYSRKPLALTNMTRTELDAFCAEFPLARACYIIDGGGSDIEAALDALLGDDPRRADRYRIRAHFLGDFDDDAYADGFVRIARSYT